MANQITLKRSSVPGKVPTVGQLALGEVAINTYDGKIYFKKYDGVEESIITIGESVAGASGPIASTTDVAEGSNLYFTQARARAAISASPGVTFNQATGKIGTSQPLMVTSAPTFAGLTLTGNIDITGSIVPSANITYDLGSPDKQWRDIYVGPGSLYVNGQKVLEDNSGTITFTADPDQNIRINTTGNGVLQLGSSTTTVQVDSTLQLTAGKRITSSDGIKVQFGDDVELNGNRLIGVGTPGSSTDAATKGYVDTAISAISTSQISEGNSNVTVTDTGTGTVTVSVDGSTALTVTSAGVVVAGNLTVSGTTTTVESNNVSIADNILTLNSDTTGAPTQNAGIEVERGDDANTKIIWDEGTDKWTFTNNGVNYYPLPVTADDLQGGTTNKFFTNANARAAFSAGTGISYNSSTGVISSSITQFTTANARAAISAGTGISYNTSTGVIESSITQYTDTNARAAISAGTGISYDSATGVISSAVDTSAFITATSSSTLSNKRIGANTTEAVNQVGYIVASAWLALNGSIAQSYYAQGANGDFFVSITTGALLVGTSMTFALTINNVGTKKPTQFMVNGTTVTPRWVNGTAVTAGSGDNKTDVYTFTVLNTDAGYILLASRVFYA